MRKSLLLVLSLVGLFISTYLWWAYTSPSNPMVCTGHGCDVVRASRYAIMFGLPMPVFGVAMYAALALLLFAETLLATQFAGRIRLAFAAISGAGFLFSLYLTGLEAFVIHAWCVWCMASAITVTIIFFLAALELIRPLRRPDEAAVLTTLRRQFVVLLAAVVIGAPAFLYLSHHGEAQPPGQASAEALKSLVRSDSHIAGNPDAPLTVVEFGDFECPVCGRQEPVVEAILQKYGARIRFVFRQFPLEQIHINAFQAAEASECAGAQGKFWEMERKLYENQFDLSEPALDRYAAELGLDKTGFDQCWSSHAMESRIRRDMADGAALGVNATPTFFIGQQKLARPIELAEFSQLLDRQLQTVASTKPRPGATPTASSGSSQSSSALPDLLGNSGANIFSGAADSTMACSNDDAKKEQPDLIRTADARQLFEGGAKPQFVDVRSARDFAGGHIPAALNVPVDEFERRWNDLPKSQTLVLYESGKTAGDNICAASRAAGRVLLAHGYGHALVKVYQDGLAGWEKAGLPVQR